MINAEAPIQKIQPIDKSTGTCVRGRKYDQIKAPAKMSNKFSVTSRLTTPDNRIHSQAPTNTTNPTLNANASSGKTKRTKTREHAYVIHGKRDDSRSRQTEIQNIVQKK